MSETKPYRGLEPSKESRGTQARLLVGGVALAASVAAMEGFTWISDKFEDAGHNLGSGSHTEHIEVVKLGEPAELVVHVEKSGE